MRPDGLVFKTKDRKKEQRVVGTKTTNNEILDVNIVIIVIGAWTVSSHGASVGVGHGRESRRKCAG